MNMIYELVLRNKTYKKAGLIIKDFLTYEQAFEERKKLHHKKNVHIEVTYEVEEYTPSFEEE